MDLNRNLIESICQELINTPSPVGYYEEIQPVFEKLAASFQLAITYDRKRTAYITLPGIDTSKTVCVGAHLDTIGLMVRHIASNGTLLLRNLGGINYNNLDGVNVHIHTRDGRHYTGMAVCQAHSTHVFDEARSQVREESNMMVMLDEFVKNAQDVRDLGIEHGDIISIDPSYEYTKNSFIKSRFIDDKAGVAAVFGALDYLKRTEQKPAYNTLFAFPLYEEIGHGGAYLPEAVSEYVAIDIGLIGPDHLGNEFAVSICAKDNYTPYDRELTSRLIQLAKTHEIAHGVDVFYHYGTDASAAIRAGNNVYGAAFGMGCFSSHGMERCHISSVEETAKLIIAYITTKQK